MVILNKHSLLLKPATTVRDNECRDVLASLNLTDYVSDFEAHLDFGAYYKEAFHWLQNSQRVIWKIPDDFTPAMSLGTTQAFDDFYIRYSTRRLFIFRGEYPYHRDVFAQNGRDLLYLDDNPSLQTLAILSVPFSATGELHRARTKLAACEQMNIPVLIDGAFLGLGAELILKRFYALNVWIHLPYSFSKLFALGGRAQGSHGLEPAPHPLRFTIVAHTNWLTLPRARLLRRFPFDFAYNKYVSAQQSLCMELGTPTIRHSFWLRRRRICRILPSRCGQSCVSVALIGTFCLTLAGEKTSIDRKIKRR